MSGLNAVQHEDYKYLLHGDEKLNDLEPYPLSQVRRTQTEFNMNMVEHAVFMSLNSSLGWLGISASPFCSFYLSHLRQELPDGGVSALKSQTNALRILKRFGTSVRFSRPPSPERFTLSSVVSADVGRFVDYGQLSIIAGQLLGMLKEDSIFHCSSSMSHKSKVHVCSTAAAEVLAAAVANEVGKIIMAALSVIFDVKVGLIVAVDPKDFYTTMSTRNAAD